jgi:hypothetical protein
MTDQDVIHVLRFLIEHELADSMFYMRDQSGDIHINVNCNDLFWWGTADCEDLTVERIPEFKKAIDDCKAVWSTGESYAGELFCARIRKMRPQNACYVNVPKQIWPLLDAAGPEREKDFSNPYSRKIAEEEWEKKAPPYFREKIG